MWKVGAVEPVRVLGAEGYPYGFDVTTDDGKPLFSLLMHREPTLRQPQHI
jgi:hypothetical protein